MRPSATALSSAFADDMVAAQQGEFPGMVCQGCHERKNPKAGNQLSG